MTKNNKRFADRETVVKGFIINTATQEFTPFEETISYARSAQKAVELVREKMQLDNDPNIIVTVNEIENEKPKPIKYNESKIYDFSIAHYQDKEDAEAQLSDGYEVKEIRWFEYEAAYWAVNGEEYVTDFVHDESPISFTKVDMRAFLVMSAEQLTGFKVIGIHDETKRETKRYCVIETANLEKCIES